MITSKPEGMPYIFTLAKSEKDFTTKNDSS
jgi:hypothetical protein